MVKRKSRKVKSRKAAKKPARRKTRRKKVARRRKISSRKISATPQEAINKNRKAHWAVYRELQKKADKAWTKLRRDVKHKAPPHILLEDRNELLLLLGECHYIAGECMRTSMRRI